MASITISFTIDDRILVFFFGWILSHFVYLPHFLYSSISGHLGWFHILALVNSPRMNRNAGFSLICWVHFHRIYTPR
jgi:hypothetical protein